jgi:hypothetical protein
MKYHYGCGPRAAKCIAVAILMCGVFSVATMLLWNALIPDLFHGPFLTFWQAVGLLVLSHILLRSFGGWRHGAWAHHRWRDRFETKLAAMTPEEREKFKEEYHHCCYRKDSDKEPNIKK